MRYIGGHRIYYSHTQIIPISCELVNLVLMQLTPQKGKILTKGSGFLFCSQVQVFQ